jgi:hypothetical protein
MKSKVIRPAARLAAALALAGLPARLQAQSLPDLASQQPLPAAQIGNASVDSRTGSATEYAPGTNPFGAARTRPAQAFILSFGHTDPRQQEELQEDIGVMSFLLEKNLDRALGNIPTIKLGIPMLARDASSRPVHGMYLEGYGAIFIVRVNFPLVGAPEPPQPKQEKPADTEWEAARERLYGQGADPRAITFARGSDYSAERVNVMEVELVRSLRNAAHVHVAADEFVVISVEGAREPSGVEVAKGEGAVVTWTGATRPKTFLALRAKKADIDALAAGQIALEDFKKTKVARSAYLGAIPANTGAGTSSIGGSAGVGAN